MICLIAFDFYNYIIWLLIFTNHPCKTLLDYHRRHDCTCSDPGDFTHYERESRRRECFGNYWRCLVDDSKHPPGHQIISRKVYQGLISFTHVVS